MRGGPSARGRRLCCCRAAAAAAGGGWRRQRLQAARLSRWRSSTCWSASRGRQSQSTPWPEDHSRPRRRPQASTWSSWSGCCAPCAAPRRAHPCDALLLRTSLHHCANLLLDDTVGGCTAAASARWERLLCTFSLLCLLVMDDAMHGSTGGAGGVPLDLLSDLTRVVQSYPGALLRLRGGVMPRTVARDAVKPTRSRAASVAESCFGVLYGYGGGGGGGGGRRRRRRRRRRSGGAY